MKLVGKNAIMSQVVDGEVTGREMFGHAIAGFGQNLIFGLWSSYMLVFYTDIFGISGWGSQYHHAADQSVGRCE